MNNALTILEKTKSVLDEVTDTMLNKGYFTMPDIRRFGLEWHECLVPEPSLRKYARRLAKENKRPFVCITRWGTWQNGKYVYKGLRIEMRKQKQLAPLVIPLQQAGFDRWSHGYKTLFVHHVDDEEFAQAYLNLLETNEQFRKILRLPA